jgi:alkaline phosphatase
MERIEQALGIVIQSEEADRLRQHVSNLNDEEIKDDYKLPFSLLAETLKKYTSVAWVGNDHTGDFVELAMAGPGSELLTPFVKNTELHNFMLNVTECVSELVANSPFQTVQ